MIPGTVFVDDNDDYGDVILVWAPFEGRPQRIALTTEAAWEFAAQIMIRTADIESNQ